MIAAAWVVVCVFEDAAGEFGPGFEVPVADAFCATGAFGGATVALCTGFGGGVVDVAGVTLVTAGCTAPGDAAAELLVDAFELALGFCAEFAA